MGLFVAVKFERDFSWVEVFALLNWYSDIDFEHEVSCTSRGSELFSYNQSPTLYLVDTTTTQSAKPHNTKTANA